MLFPNVDLIAKGKVYTASSHQIMLKDAEMMPCRVGTGLIFSDRTGPAVYRSV